MRRFLCCALVLTFLACGGSATEPVELSNLEALNLIYAARCGVSESCPRPTACNRVIVNAQPTLMCSLADVGHCLSTISRLTCENDTIPVECSLDCIINATFTYRVIE